MPSTTSGSRKLVPTTKHTCASFLRLFYLFFCLKSRCYSFSVCIYCVDSMKCSSYCDLCWIHSFELREVSLLSSFWTWHTSLWIPGVTLCCCHIWMVAKWLHNTENTVDCNFPRWSSKLSALRPRWSRCICGHCQEFRAKVGTETFLLLLRSVENLLPSVYYLCKWRLMSSVIFTVNLLL